MLIAFCMFLGFISIPQIMGNAKVLQSVGSAQFLFYNLVVPAIVIIPFLPKVPWSFTWWHPIPGVITGLFAIGLATLGQKMSPVTLVITFVCCEMMSAIVWECVSSGTYPSSVQIVKLTLFIFCVIIGNIWR